jgi:teichuronic acid biosynthesis glycosyltransferase TuaG
MSNRVLVVTPTWCTKENNRLPLLLQTVYWVQQQTHDDFLHVVVDDGSTDDTWDYLCELAGKSNRIMLLHQENKGSSAAINYGVEQGLRHSNSKYVTVTHSDDLLLPHSLEKRVMDAENAKARFVYTDMIVFRENGESYVQEALELTCIKGLFNLM